MKKKYFPLANRLMFSSRLHLTTMCLRYPPTIVACVCIHLACKWSNYMIPASTEGKPWFQYVDPLATQALLERLTEEFLHIFEKCPSRLKKTIMASTEAVSALVWHWLLICCWLFWVLSRSRFIFIFFFQRNDLLKSEQSKIYIS